MERRAFLWRGPGLAGLAGFVAACGRRDHPSSRPEGDGPVPPMSLVVRPWADDIVWLARAEPPQPVAYVSMATRRIFVGYDHRDRASWLLDAHISVSTGLWRIPLPGDSRSVPVTPGDPLREFEELDLAAWDPGASPSIDDIRIVRGRPVERTVYLDCVRGQRGAPARYRTEPRTVVVADGAGDVTTREDFTVDGTGLRFSDAICSSRAEIVQLVGWRVRDG